MIQLSDFGLYGINTARWARDANNETIYPLEPMNHEAAALLGMDSFTGAHTPLETDLFGKLTAAPDLSNPADDLELERWMLENDCGDR
jgi:hypothetical protein